METETVKTANLAHSDMGNGDITLLFVHGSFINKEYWDAPVNHFKDNYRVVTVDLAGHGKSSQVRHQKWTMEEFAGDVVGVIKALGLKNVILIGHSDGADIVLEIAVKYPEHVLGVIAVDYFKNAGTELPEEIQPQVDQILHNLKSDFANTSEVYARQSLLTPETDSLIVKQVIHDFRNADPEMGFAMISEKFSYYERERDLLKQLLLKLYLINVDYTPTNEAALKEYTALGYEIIPIKGTSHYPMLENPGELNSALEKAIKEISATMKKEEEE